MFALDLWDSPIQLVGEIALSVAVIVGILFIVRVANARSVPPAQRGAGDPVMPPGSPDEPSAHAAAAEPRTGEKQQ